MNLLFYEMLNAKAPDNLLNVIFFGITSLTYFRLLSNCWSFLLEQKRLCCRSVFSVLINNKTSHQVPGKDVRILLSHDLMMFFLYHLLVKW